MDTTTAIIQFIGIVLFTTAVPNDPGLHAILPRIGHVHDLHTPNGPSEEQESFVDGVEDHVAVIIYREEDRLHRVGGWRADGTLKNGWEYVRLDGEHVQFLANGVNGTPAIPSLLPRVGVAPTCLQPEAPLTLKPEFQWPYKGAVGVVDVRGGTLDVCETNSRTTTARVDTRMIVETEGVLVIAAAKPNERAKTIALDGDAVVYVVNVPPEFVLQGIESPRTGEPHWDAYNDMLNGSCAAAPEPSTNLAPLPECDMSQLTEAYRRARRLPPADFHLINSECSTAQLP